MILSHRLQNIKPSAIFKVAALAKQLQTQGRNIINLSIGEPDFDTPPHIIEAAHQALRDGMTKYTAVDGIPTLKKAIIHKFQRDNALSYSLDEVMASTGCKQAIFNVLFSLLNPGEEVIIPAPYWTSYPDMVLSAEGIPIILPTSHSTYFKITPQQLDAAITPKTKVLILESPSNPTGMMYSEQELEAFAAILLKHPRVYIISDDIYEHILWRKAPFQNIIQVCSDLKARTIICHGVSKSYAMTGFRLGYAAGPSEIIAAMTNIQSQVTSNPNSIAQYAAVAALEGDQTCVKTMGDIYEKRHQVIYQGINKIPGFQCFPAEGAFYSFVDISSACLSLKLSSDIDFAAYLLKEAGIAVVPGSAFGNAHCIRISYAAHENLLQEAIKRLQKLFSPSI